jgi:sarcosine oxidase subunit beta
VAGVETTAGFISAQIVVIAAGAYANRLLKQLGIDLGLFPRRSRVVVFRWPESVDPARKHRVVIDSTHQSWFRPEGDQGTLVGVTYGNRDGVDPDDFEETIEQDYIDFARNALAARFPAFAQATMRGGWSGVFMQSPDDHPIIDMVPSIDGLFVMTGDSGTSFKTSPAIGICLAEWIVEGAPRLVDLTPFRATRFAEGRPWIDEFAYSEGFDVSVAR